MKFALPSFVLAVLSLGATTAMGADVLSGESSGPQPNDNLNAVLWDQTAVEAQAVMAQAYVLAHEVG